MQPVPTRLPSASILTPGGQLCTVPLVSSHYAILAINMLHGDSKVFHERLKIIHTNFEQCFNVKKGDYVAI